MGTMMDSLVQEGDEQSREHNPDTVTFARQQTQGCVSSCYLAALEGSRTALV